MDKLYLVEYLSARDPDAPPLKIGSGLSVFFSSSEAWGKANKVMSKALKEGGFEIPMVRVTEFEETVRENALGPDAVRAMVEMD